MKIVRICLMLALVLAATFSANTSVTMAAGAFPAYTSGVQVANLEATVANVTLTAYRSSDGATDGAPFSTTIDANGSKTFFPIANVSQGFSGSLVVASDKKVAAISNILSADFKAGAAYVGSSSGGSPLSLPLLMKGNSGLNTWFSVQNAGTADATVNVAYSDGTSASATVKPSAAHVFYQADENHPVKVFAGTVTGNQPLVAAVIQESSSIMFAYTGFTKGTTTPVFPLVNANNNKIVTGIQIQNGGTQATDVTLSYTPAGAGAACTEKQTIQPGASNTYALTVFSTTANGSIVSDCAKGAKFIGSAKVTINTTNQNLVGIGNQLLPGVNGEAYNSFAVEDATNKVVLPLIMDHNSGLFTGFSVQLVGGSPSTVNCTFTGTSYTVSKALNVGDALVDNQNGKIFPTLPAGSVRYVGGATCTADKADAKIVAVVNEAGTGTGDQLLVYEGAASQ